MISILLPVYNESKILRQSVLRLRSYLFRTEPNYEILILDDHSTDETPRIADKLENATTRVVHFEQRIGKGASLVEGIRKANGDIILFMDVDMAADFHHIQEFLSEIKHGVDIVVGSRLLPTSVTQKRTLSREFFSRTYNLLLRYTFRTEIHDHQCGFKAFRKSSVMPLLSQVKSRHFFWDAELLILAQAKGLKIIEFPIEWTDRSGGKLSLASMIISMSIELFCFHLRMLFG